MKRHLPLLFLLLILFLAVTTACGQTQTPPQVTSAQTGEDQSVIGSTDGIFVMGVVIVLITSVPLVLRKKKK